MLKQTELTTLQAVAGLLGFGVHTSSVEFTTLLWLVICAGLYQQTAFYVRAGYLHPYSTLSDSVSGVPNM